MSRRAFLMRWSKKTRLPGEIEDLADNGRDALVSTMMTIPQMRLGMIIRSPNMIFDLILAVFTLASETRVLTQLVDYARIPLGCAPCANAPHLRCR